MCCVGTNISVKQVYCVYINHVVDLFSLQGCRPRPLLLCKVYFRDKKKLHLRKYPHKCPSRITKHCVNAVSEGKSDFFAHVSRKICQCNFFYLTCSKELFCSRRDLGSSSSCQKLHFLQMHWLIFSMLHWH